MSGLISSHAFTPNVITVTGALVADSYYVCTASGSTTQTLPAATGTGKVIVLENTGTGTISLARAGTDTINGATSVSISPYGQVKVRDIAAVASAKAAIPSMDLLTSSPEERKLLMGIALTPAEEDTLVTKYLVA